MDVGGSKQNDFLWRDPRCLRSLFRRYIEGTRKNRPNEVDEIANGQVTFGVELHLGGQYGAAEEFLREAVAHREKTTPDDWRTFDALTLLGGSLCSQKKYD
jgi:hypothetical protein